jgi:hypothetical protein
MALLHLPTPQFPPTLPARVEDTSALPVALADVSLALAQTPAAFRSLPSFRSPTWALVFVLTVFGPCVFGPCVFGPCVFGPCVVRAAEPVSRYVEDYPAAASKKGLQVELVDDALVLGVKHAALNLNLCALVDPAGSGGQPAWERSGKTFHFREGYLRALDRQVKTLSDQGILVSIILLTYRSGNAEVDRVMIHPQCEVKPPNNLGAFNTATEEGREWLAASLEFLAERWSRPSREHGRVVNWIVGNEVNSHWWWSNMGRVSMEEFAAQYEQAVRIVHSAVRSQSSADRVFVSLEHHWNIRYPAGDELQSFPGRAFLEHFAELARTGGDYDWHLAFHPYPENLFEPRFWNDKTATHAPDTPRITFKNLEQLVASLAREPLRYDGQVRRIILSEQGFHTPRGKEGERVQAAAYCYAYKLVEAFDAIDAFILHRHVDHDGEGGLLLGLRRNKPRGEEARPRKLIYECFRAADTPEWEAAFDFALPIIGLEDWTGLAVPPAAQ